MKINLNIDQILEQVLPWNFTVTLGGKLYKTRRPTIGELAAMQSVGGKNVGAIEPLVVSLFAEPPNVRWDLPSVTAFLEGYLEYFSLHTKKKEGGSTEEVEGKARRAVASQWEASTGDS